MVAIYVVDSPDAELVQVRHEAAVADRRCRSALSPHCLHQIAVVGGAVESRSARRRFGGPSRWPRRRRHPAQSHVRSSSTASNPVMLCCLWDMVHVLQPPRRSVPCRSAINPYPARTLITVSPCYSRAAHHHTRLGFAHVRVRPDHRLRTSGCLTQPLRGTIKCNGTLLRHFTVFCGSWC